MLAALSFACFCLLFCSAGLCKINLTKSLPPNQHDCADRVRVFAEQLSNKTPVSTRGVSTQLFYKICSLLNPIGEEKEGGIFIGVRPIPPGSITTYEGLLKAINPGNVCVMLYANNPHAMGHFVASWDDFVVLRGVTTKQYFFFDSFATCKLISAPTPQEMNVAILLNAQASKILTSAIRTLYLFNLPYEPNGRKCAVKSALQNLNDTGNVMLNEYVKISELGIPLPYNFFPEVLLTSHVADVDSNPSNPHPELCPNPKPESEMFATTNDAAPQVADIIVDFQVANKNTEVVNGGLSNEATRPKRLRSQNSLTGTVKSSKYSVLCCACDSDKLRESKHFCSVTKRACCVWCLSEGAPEGAGSVWPCIRCSKPPINK